MTALCQNQQQLQEENKRWAKVQKKQGEKVALCWCKVNTPMIKVNRMKGKIHTWDWKCFCIGGGIHSSFLQNKVFCTLCGRCWLHGKGLPSEMSLQVIWRQIWHPANRHLPSPCQGSRQHNGCGMLTKDSDMARLSPSKPRPEPLGRIPAKATQLCSLLVPRCHLWLPALQHRYPAQAIHCFSQESFLMD